MIDFRSKSLSVSVTKTWRKPWRTSRPPAVHFEQADDPKRAIAFYEKVFGETIIQWVGPSIIGVTTGSDDELEINGVITPRMVEEHAR
ncbi:MAG: VOC family protein [Halobacteriota archaeon]